MQERQTQYFICLNVLCCIYLFIHKVLNSNVHIMNNLTSGLWAKGCESRIHGSQDMLLPSPTILIVPLHYDFEGNSKQRCIAMVKDILLNVYGLNHSATKGD